MPDVIESIRLVRDPSSFEEAISLLTDSVGAIQASTNLSDEDLSRLNAQLTRLQLVVSAKWCDRK